MTLRNAPEDPSTKLPSPGDKQKRRSPHFTPQTSPRQVPWGPRVRELPFAFRARHEVKGRDLEEALDRGVVSARRPRRRHCGLRCEEGEQM